jgi:uncharacterized protein
MITRRRLAILALLAVMAAGACRRTPPAADAQGAGVEQIDAARPFTNRLIAEKSPYLQQHAHNPVDWYPWGAEAFEKARREDKAIFLSIGYSTCHWCHVMEAESFSDPEIAAYMNAHFVSIKVDREERPDLDRVYQNYVIGVSEGGWPASLFLTPDLKPFSGANYLPPDDNSGGPGFRTVLQRVAAMWETNRGAALRAADEGTQSAAARSQATLGAVGSIDATALLDRAYHELAATFDQTSGGFGDAPKFPRPVVLNFLLRYYARTRAQPALDMALQTLRRMANGGIHDQLAGGFHRYAVDPAWRVPHFEKMLYDQAQLAPAYIDAYQASGDLFFRDIARSILDYVLRDMRDRDGAFFSAEDADSRTSTAATALVEGAYYVWTPADLRRVLGRDAELVAYYYGIDDTHSALSVQHSIGETAAQFQSHEPDVRALLASARHRLLDARASRPRPHRDDKVLVAWNGLMMSALARAAQVLDDRAYLDAARRQATFIEQRMYDALSGTLRRRYRQGDADIDALLEDYAFLVQGLLDLYEASFDQRWLSWAVRLQQTQDRLFWDELDGGYFSTRADAGDLLARAKEEYDGVEPSGNSVSAMNLVRLWKVTTDPAWRQRADATIVALAPRLTRSASTLPQMLAALDFSRARSKEIVIAGTRDAADTRALLRLVRRRFMPNKVLLLAEGGAAQAALAKAVPFIEAMAPRGGRATIYVCINYACRLPTSDPTVAARLLETE